MTTVNEARFTIEGTASEDSNGDRGYDATNGQTLDVTLEVNPSSVLSATYSVYDSTDSESPLASKDATAITWNENSQKSITPSGVNDTVTIDMPASGAHSYIIRCQVVTPRGAVYFERMVTVRTSYLGGLRKTVPAEGEAYSDRGESDAQNEIVESLTAIDTLNDPAISRPNDFVLIDDFYSIDSDVWTETETASGDVRVITGDGESAYVAGDLAGVLRLKLTGTADAAALADTILWFNGGHDPVFRARVKTPSDLNNATMVIGLADSSSLSDYAVFATDSGGAWAVSCGRSGGSSDSDSGGTCAAGTVYDLLIVMTGDDSVLFYVDGVLIATLDAANSVPDADTSLGRIVFIDPDVDTTSVCYVDYMDLRLTRGNYGTPS